MLGLYALTIFLSAALLFFVEPMFARMVVPLLGGSPGVWNTCMVFYQAALLAGYAYAHWTTEWLGVRRQAVVHLAVLLAPLALLPIAVWTPSPPPSEASPIPWLLAVLGVSLGLPFFALSTTNPLLQRWFAATGHPAAQDPYFLYAASNLGSMVALLSYPFLVEPTLRLAEQSRLWSIGYGLLAALVATCAAVLWRTAQVRPLDVERAATAGPAAAGPADSAPALITPRQRVRWLVLSFVPSSLLLGVTTYLTTDIASVPLLWILPLSLYLLTFILVFARRPLLPHAWMVRLLPWVLLPLALSMAAVVKEGGLWPLISLHLAGFFVAAMVCHGELARERPPPRYLTEYYLWMSVGGVLGGLFNALVAPVVFRTVVEYPIALVLACLLSPRPDRRADAAPRALVLDLGLPAALALVIWGLLGGMQQGILAAGTIGKLLVLGVPALLCFAFKERPLRFGLGLGVVLFMGTLFTALQRQVLHVERSFFGVHRVTIDGQGKYHWLEHGTTYHGWQSLDPARRCEPIGYYFHNGPIGELFASQRIIPGEQIAVLGLGTGSLAGYLGPGQQMTFYEIDPAVKRIAEDPRYFTFLSDCSRQQYSIVLGDARVRLSQAPDHSYGLIVLDVFTSDSIPLHLLTREAVEIYAAKLAPGGLLVMNISNRHFNLEPVVAKLAAATGLLALSCPDLAPSAADEALGKSPAHFLALGRRPEDFGALWHSARWRRLADPAGQSLWTDDYANVLGALKR